MGKAQMLAVWGAPGTGKTVTTVKLALELAAQKKNTILLMCDFIAPAPQTIQPKIPTTGKSLGELLTLPTISQDAILSYCIPFGGSPYISMLGYQHGDNAYTYAQYAKERAVDLLTLLRHLADYVLIDISSAFSFDTLSATALENADAVMRLCSCDLKSISYMASSLPLLAAGRFAADRHIHVLSAVKPGQDSGEYNNAFGGAAYSLPFVPELEDQFYAAGLMEGLCTKAAKEYSTVIRSIVRDILLDSTEKAAVEKKLRSPRREKEFTPQINQAAKTSAEFRRSSEEQKKPKPAARLLGRKKPEIEESGGLSRLFRKGGKR